MGNRLPVPVLGFGAGKFLCAFLLIQFTLIAVTARKEKETDEDYSQFLDNDPNHLMVTQKRRNLLCGFFNLNLFKRKILNPNAFKIIVRIIKRYDVLGIEGIQDESGFVMKTLLSAVNQQNPNPFAVNISNRVGRTHAKMQYALFYRMTKLEVLQATTFDGDKNLFRFPPMAILVKVQSSPQVPKFGIIIARIKAKDAVKEINGLVDVRKWAMNQFQDTKDIVIGGNFNAGCNFLRKRHWRQIRLRTGKEYKWLIQDFEDTTTSKITKCPYDRVVVVGDWIQKSVLPHSGRPFKFDAAYSLEPEETQTISEHYPVEFIFEAAKV